MGLVAYGESLAEAFSNSAYGLFSLIVEPNQVKEKESRKVTVQAQDAEGLLFNWINELIYIFEVERLLFKSFNITEYLPFFFSVMPSPHAALPAVRQDYSGHWPKFGHQPETSPRIHHRANTQPA
jgi:hypothetical protein